MTTRTRTLTLISKTTTSHVHHTFWYISFPFLHDYDVNMPNFAFYGGRKQANDEILFLFLSLNLIPWNSASGGFAYNWQSKWVGIIAIKTKRTQIRFLSNVLVAVTSLDLKVPINKGQHDNSDGSPGSSKTRLDQWKSGQLSTGSCLQSFAFHLRLRCPC